METRVLTIDRDHIDLDKIQEAGEVLKNGGLVAFPTETVYGLGANALNPQAAQMTYAVKGRPSDNPLIVHVADVEALDAIADVSDGRIQLLAKAFWPGALTLILEKKALVPYETSGGLDTIAVRIPNDAIALALIKAAGGYVSAPSANTSGRPSPTRASHVEEDMNGQIAMILDGGPVSIGVESTILDLTVDPPAILRPGAVTKEMIEDVIQEEVVGGLALTDANEHPKAPGMKYKHYAPKGQLVIVEGAAEAVAKRILTLAQQALQDGERVAVLCTEETSNYYQAKAAAMKLPLYSLGKKNYPESVANRFYHLLRRLDQEDFTLIYSESIPSEGIGVAVMNRMEKAAGFQFIQA